MTQDNEALIRQAFAAFGGDLDAVLEMCAHDVVVVEPPDRPDGTTHHGREGVLAAFAGWVDLWDDYSAEIVGMTEVGDHVVVLTHQRGRGQGSASRWTRSTRSCSPSAIASWLPGGCSAARKKRWTRWAGLG